MLNVNKQEGSLRRSRRYPVKRSLPTWVAFPSLRPPLCSLPRATLLAQAKRIVKAVFTRAEKRRRIKLDATH
ncbi:hypothetical protein E2C01_078960 [Portunus trituberculatus]|uniref:Uncharacterized protein n=1 Tax=Portunus trituberculatus TaxID=210409 RepID=A0A5B7IFR0_PORTR|nr:hypothetical protein [Portunus trituberculatus]